MTPVEYFHHNREMSKMRKNQQIKKIIQIIAYLLRLHLKYDASESDFALKITASNFRYPKFYYTVYSRGKFIAQVAL